MSIVLKQIQSTSSSSIYSCIKSYSVQIIQKKWRSMYTVKNFNNYKIEILNAFNKHTDDVNDMFIKCLKIYQKYPPAKNEYKFIFGGLVQLAFIELLGKVFHKCLDLDELHDFGSEYKNDCCLYVTPFVKFNISIKAKSKTNGNVILINKHGNNIVHNLKNLITFVLILETHQIIIINHNDVPEQYIKDNEANISYKSSLITFIKKNKPELVYTLKQNESFKDFMEKEYNTLVPINLYKELYNKL